MFRTGVFATEEEVKSLKLCLNTPMIMLQCGPRETPLQGAHGYAISHGLPEITGYYGCDLKTGEFVSAQ